MAQFTGPFKKGDKIQLGTSPRVYIVTRNETPQGRVHCMRGSRTFIFRSFVEDISLWNGIEEKDVPGLDNPI
jgi:hypothetical protein